MAGKKKTSTTRSKNSNWGGARKGAGGPKKQNVTDAQIDAMLKTARKWAKEKGYTLDDILCRFAYGDQEEGWKLTARDRLAAIDMLKKYTMAKKSEKDVKVDDMRGPAIGLPPKRNDPAKIVPIEGGKKG